VDDASTAFLMREFYRLRYTEGIGKSEALRGAQTAVMRAGPDGSSGTVTASGAEGSAGAEDAAGATGTAGTVDAAGTAGTIESEGSDNRGAAISAVAAAGAAEAGAGASEDGAGDSAETPRWEGSGWSHPYYWAPFILMGNWR
jgi:CHAT domain-containing protein